MELVTRRSFLKQSFVLVALASAGRFMAACVGAAALPFITMGLNLIGTILPTIPSIIAAISSLTGHTISAASVAKLTQVLSGVQDLFSQAQSALIAYQQNADPTLIAKIQDLLGQVKTRMQAILTDVQITDQATVAKILSIANSFIDLANNILVILPSVANGKVQAKRVSKAQLAQVSSNAWAAKFNAAVKVKTSNPEVEKAFANVVAVPKN
jgi:hypothetical protein